MFVEHKEAGEAQETTLQPWQKQMLRAIDYINERGWCQGSYGLGGGPVCAVGALLLARRGRGAAQAHHEAYERFSLAVGSKAVSAWNDENGRTKEQVVAKLRSVALGG